MHRKLWLALVLAASVAVVTATEKAANLRLRSKVHGSSLSTTLSRESTLVITGVLSPVVTVPIDFPIVELAVPLNSYVVKGEVIGITYSAAVPGQAAPGNEPDLWLDEANAAVAEAREHVREIEAELEAAREGEADAEVQRVSTEIGERATVDRLGNSDLLFQEGSMSEATHYQALFNLRSAEIAAEASQSRLDTTASAIAEKETRLHETRARLAAAELQLQRAREAVDREQPRGWAEVVAPADGFLVARDLTASAFGIGSNAAPLRVETLVPEAEIDALRDGQRASVYLDLQPKVTLNARVSEIAETPIDTSNGTVYPVTLLVDNPRGLSLAGELVHVRTAGSAQ